MKKNSDDLRQSSIVEILKDLTEKKFKLIVYEPLLSKKNILCEGCKIINSLDKFKKLSNLIITNRFDNNLDDVKFKVYTRDLFNRD